MRYYTDGSSTIGVKSAYCVVNEKGMMLKKEESFAPNNKTSNEEEYRGVIAALKICNTGDEVLTDSQLVVNQINGLHKVKKKHLLTYRDEAKRLADEKQVLVKWIPREENLAGKIFE